MNFFSSTAFLQALAESFFAGKHSSIELFRVDGATYRLLLVEGRPITRWSFLDLFEPVEQIPPAVDVKTLDRLPRAFKGLQTVEAWRAAPRGGWDACPLVDWSGFATWEAYQAAFPAASNPDSRRCRRVLERELGPLEFSMNDEEPAVLDCCLRWKSAQYRATGQPDVFRDHRYAYFYELLHRRGELVVSSLRAGDRLVAAHIGMRDGPRRQSWLPAYDAAYAKGAPGRLLLEKLLEHSYRSNDREFDFLFGDESYKFNFATHVRLCGWAGYEPLTAQVERLARPHLKRALRHMPSLQARVRELRQRFTDR